MTDTSLSPNALLAAKFLALCFLLGGYLTWIPEVFLPLVPFLEPLHGSTTFKHLLEGTIVAAAVCLWLNTAARLSCALIGVAMLLAVVSSAPYYHENTLYTALFFLLIGLSDRRSESVLLRAQLLVVYLGAGLKKALDPDWRSGAFVRDWLDHQPTATFFGEMWHLIPQLDMAQMVGWAAMVTELSLAGLLLARQSVPLAVFVSAGFHTVLVVVTGGWTFGMFWYALIATYLVLLDWPSSLIITYNPRRRLHRVLHGVIGRLNFDRSISWRPRDTRRVQLDTEAARWGGWSAVAWSLIYTPVFHVACAAAFILLPDGWMAITFVVFGLLACVASGYVNRIRKAQTLDAQAGVSQSEQRG
jgi:hypothetical protein